MKKLFILFAAATLFIGVQSCKQKDEAATEETATTEETTEAAPAGDSGTASTDTGRIPVAPTDPIKK